MIHNILEFNKNLNKNVVVASVNVENNNFVPFTSGVYKDCLINLLWHTKEEENNGKYPIEELNKVDQYVYGYKILESSDKSIVFTPSNVNRRILIKLINNKVRLYTQFNNVAGELFNIYCHLNSTFENITLSNIINYKKRLEYVIIYGKDQNGNDIQEKITDY